MHQSQTQQQTENPFTFDAEEAEGCDEFNPEKISGFIPQGSSICFPQLICNLSGEKFRPHRRPPKHSKNTD